MLVSDLFPQCARKDCDTKGTHNHVLPMQQKLLDSKEKFVALVGGLGSGKTLGVSVLGHLLSIGVPGNMGIIVRRSLPKLHDSALRIYLEVLQRSGVDFKARELRDGWPHRIIYANGSEVFFRETKDLGRFLSAEFGWFDIAEAQEEPESTFKNLSDRLRLPRAARYYKGMIDTNPPSNQHWIARLFPKSGSWIKEVKLPDGKIIKTSWAMIQSSTYDNPFLSPDYVAGLLLLHTPAEAKRLISGNYGFTAEGDPVYPQFDFLKHVGDPATRRMTLYRVWDFGYHGPTVCFGQIFRCTKNQVHVNVLHEVMKQDTETEAFAPIVFLEQAQMFPEIPLSLTIDGGDAAGAAVSEKGPGPILRLSRTKADGGYDLRFSYQKVIDIDPGLDKVRLLLRTKCNCGYYLLMFHRRCSELIQAMSGGYHFPKERPGKEKGRKPVKDGHYDNIADTLRYLVWLFYARVCLDIDQSGEGGLYTGTPSDTGWSWMGA